ncbi:MAG: HNH endonuclease [Verrucomicrobia bacterium]|nr:HNH endonuclease [Verrucomicrobiota bacterium]
MRNHRFETVEQQWDAHTGNSCRRVLVLNRNWQAVNIIGVKRAFSLLWQEHAKVINTFDDTLAAVSASEWLEFSRSRQFFANAEYVRTIRMNILLPKVMLLNEFDRLPVAEVKFNRQSVFERDNFTCQYSGKVCRPKDLTLDHVIPRERGGKTTWENIVTCSREVNARKANRLPHEAGLTLLRRPKKPNWRPFVCVAAGSDIDPTWISFLQLERAG